MKRNSITEIETLNLDDVRGGCGGGGGGGAQRGRGDGSGGCHDQPVAQAVVPTAAPLKPLTTAGLFELGGHAPVAEVATISAEIDADGPDAPVAMVCGTHVAPSASAPVAVASSSADYGAEGEVAEAPAQELTFGTFAPLGSVLAPPATATVYAEATEEPAAPAPAPAPAPADDGMACADDGDCEDDCDDDDDDDDRDEDEDEEAQQLQPEPPAAAPIDSSMGGIIPGKDWSNAPVADATASIAATAADDGEVIASKDFMSPPAAEVAPADTFEAAAWAPATIDSWSGGAGTDAGVVTAESSADFGNLATTGMGWLDGALDQVVNTVGQYSPEAAAVIDQAVTPALATATEAAPQVLSSLSLPSDDGADQATSLRGNAMSVGSANRYF